jgi:hypothetical protein
MSGSGNWPGDETAETRALGLPPAERQILAALAVVGHASLSADELADIGSGDDVIPLLEDLERRGLVRLDERRRYSVLGGIGADLRRTNDALASGDRLLGYFTTLARGGTLSGEDVAAILGLTEWAAEVGRLERLLELVKTTQACFEIGHRTEEWVTLVRRARTAARSLGDRQSESWALEQLAAVAAHGGDAVAAQQYLREAEELRYGPRPATTREVTETVVAPPPQPAPASSGGGVPAWVLWALGIVLALLAGVGLGFVLDSGGSSSSNTTAPVSVTLTRPGTTLTAQETLTLPATTVVTTSVSTETTTVTTTVTTSSLTAPG